MKCPTCNTEIPDKEIAKHLAAKGGSRSGSNLTAAQRKKKASDAAKARWKRNPKPRKK